MRVRAYSTLGPRAGGESTLALDPPDEMSAYRGVAARLWTTQDRRVLHLSLIHVDEWAPTAQAGHLAALSPEPLGSVRLETALAS